GELVVSGGGPAVVGLNRLGKSLKFYADNRGPDSLHGKGTGAIHFWYSGDTVTFGGTLEVVNFALGPKNAADWQEPALRLEAAGQPRNEDAAGAVRAPGGGGRHRVGIAPGLRLRRRPRRVARPTGQRHRARQPALGHLRRREGEHSPHRPPRPRAGRAFLRQG